MKLDFISERRMWVAHKDWGLARATITQDTEIYEVNGITWVTVGAVEFYGIARGRDVCAQLFTRGLSAHLCAGFSDACQYYFPLLLRPEFFQQANMLLYALLDSGETVNCMIRHDFSPTYRKAHGLLGKVSGWRLSEPDPPIKITDVGDFYSDGTVRMSPGRSGYGLVRPTRKELFAGWDNLMLLRTGKKGVHGLFDWFLYGAAEERRLDMELGALRARAARGV